MNRRIVSGKILKDLNYEFYLEIEKEEKPDLSNIKFKDLFEEFEKSKELSNLSNKYLYKHQVEAIETLDSDKNLILISGTGSGKTEAWLLYFIKEFKKNNNFKVVAVYPTLALANDQIDRINKYSKVFGFKTLKLDSKSKESYLKKYGASGLARLLINTNILITNPAFLWHDFKKFLIEGISLLSEYLKEVDLFVLDEFDFYSPRSIAILLFIVSFLSKINNKIRYVILTATLSNPEDLANFLKSNNKKDTSIVFGKPFKVKNYFYVVLGKNLDEIIKNLREVAKSLKNKVDKEIIEILESKEKTRENIFKVIDYFRALENELGINLEIPNINIKVEEILEKYIEDEYVTIVFTNSIAKAEEIYRKLREKIKEDLIATHHHLVSKEKREEIENKLREGKIKIVISPRTLAQGIDIPNIARIVHIGLPDSVREFYQREGRKGRREEIGFTESVLIPYSRWDFEILNKGLNNLKKWLSLGIEKTIINPKNKYITLISSLVKLLSNWYKEKLNEEEIGVLRETGLDKYINEKQKLLKIFEKINFYEFAPPYGIRRYLVNKREIPLEPIGHCDLVERFQIGCIDYSNDAIVIDIKSGKTKRYVASVYEKKIKDLKISEYDFLYEAYDQYKELKLRWREDVRFFKDLLSGKIFSKVYCVVYTPKDKFGEYIKIPNRVVWFLNSSKPKIVRKGNKVSLFYDKKPIYIPTLTYGEYRDYTYSFLYSSSISDVNLLRLGLAYLMVLLRVLEGIKFETIKYDIIRFGNKVFFELHEPESAGIIESLDWKNIRKKIENYKGSDLDYILLGKVDDLAYSYAIEKAIDLDFMKRLTIKVIEDIEIKNKVEINILGKKFKIPKPSRSLKITSIDYLLVNIEVRDYNPKVLIAISYYDGDEVKTKLTFFTLNPFEPLPKDLRDLERDIEDLILYDKFRLVTIDKRKFGEDLEKIGLRILPKLIYNSIDLKEILIRRNIKVDIEKFLEEVEPKEVDISNIIKEINRWIENMERKEEIFKNKKVEKLIKDYLKWRVKSLYKLYLLIEEV